jgi:phosphatidylglycerophosphate synthase
MARGSLKRLVGLERKGEPSGTASSQAPLRPLTIPNLLTALRLALLVPTAYLALTENPAHHPLPVVLFSVMAVSDVADGALARLTGQYSRLGALLDPVSDRLVVVVAVAVLWRWDLLPRAGLAVLAAREAAILLLGRYALAQGIAVGVSGLGRAALAAVGFSLLLGLLGATTAGTALLAFGLLLSYASLLDYIRRARALLAGGQGAAASPNDRL